MGEIKSVKVDNWGVFFLQKLQNFFNKTDYCDLTLQFRDNSQLKVHRLVLSACTDYFNVLEQTCEVIDDALIMPNELQADVVVPIVNFMYTGTLEFELKMYGKLLRTAKEMNMTVLLKLLEAHRRTMENVNRQQRPPSPKAIRRRVPVAGQTNAMPIHQTQITQGRRVLAANVVAGNPNVVQRRIVQTKTAGTNVSPVQIQYCQQIGSTSVVRTSALRAGQSVQQQNVQTFIKNEPTEYESYEAAGGQLQASSSPFEQLRKGYNNNKRPAVSTFLSPPSKKPNLEDVKEFAEQQRMRKQIAAEYGEDAEFDSMMDDDGMIHNDDDDDDGLAAAAGNPMQSSSYNSSNVSQATTSSVATATVTIKPESDNQPPTIIVKDHSGSKMDHAKIISEVLRQYPQLAKGNKNIKLKIMPAGQGQAQRIVIKNDATVAEQPQQQPQSNQAQLRSVATTHVITKSGEKIPQQQFEQQQASTQATSYTKPTGVQPAAAATTDSTQQKRRIDSKTMHALIALGAENMTGPWLCLRCGLNGRPISIPSYRGFRRHLINTHKETIDPALCEHCGWRSQNNRELHFHSQIEHKIKTTLYTFPECLLCAELFLDTNALNQHMLDSHPSANKQQCIYCNKIFMRDTQLYTHLKLYHKHQAIEDGIIDVSEEDYPGSQNDDSVDMEEHMESNVQPSQRSSHEAEKGKKVKILSDISLPMASSIVKLSGNTLTANSNVIDAQTKFVTADGNEMILTDEQRQEIISQLNQDHNNGAGVDGGSGDVVMVLNDAIFTGGDSVSGENLENVNSTEAAAEEGASAATIEETNNPTDDIADTDELDDSQIYAELASDKAEKEKQAEAQEADESLKWAENLISQHDMADNENESYTAKTQEEDKAKKELISKKLKELTVDWSEDENEDEEEGVEDSAEQIEGESEVNKEKAEDDDEAPESADETNEPEQTAPEGKSIQKTQVDEGENDIESIAKDGANESAGHELSEHDALELAMHNLHEEGQAETEAEIETNANKTPSEVALVKESENIVSTAAGDAVAQPKELAAEHADNSSLSTALLDELMSADSTTADEQTSAVKEEEEPKSQTTANESSAPATSVHAEDDLDAFAKAGLNEEEEFSAISSIVAAKTSPTTAKNDQINIKTEKDDANEKTNEKTIVKAEDVKEAKTEEIPSSKTTKITAGKANTSNDWEDLDYDDSKLH